MIDNTYIFDFEVGAKDWLLVAKNVETGIRSIFHNDNEAVQEFMEDRPFLGGFNNKHYDNFILKAILCDFSVEEVKEINDLIIVHEINGWQIPALQEFRVFFDSFDLMDDTQEGTSLKAFEAHLGIPIEETEVDFNLPRAWTEEELKLMIKYCSYDVDATEILYKIRRGYLQNKYNLGMKIGLDGMKSLYKTNAQLTAVYLQAKKPEKPYTDERDYEYPTKLLKQYIPQEVFDFFDRMKDRSIPDEVVFSEKLKIMIGECAVTIAYGGIHGAIASYSETESETRTIRNKDVASYYPHLMVLPLSEGKEVGFCSRNIPSPQIYINTLEDRVKAKKAGDKMTANALKLVLNTTYGAMLGSFNDLYDPLMGRSVCVTGQLFLLELSCHLLEECPTLKIVQLNTDGIMVSLDKSDEAKWEEITQEWQDRTGFELEEDFIHKIVQKDVNNYVEVPVGNGSPKVKGGQLVRGVLTNDNVDFVSMGYPNWENLSGGAFKINNNAVIVAKAIEQYCIDETPAEETINNCDDIFMFMIISKVGQKYSECYHSENGVEVKVQKVNRVYAVDNYQMGTITKIHAETGRASKVAGLPLHCMIDNNNQLTIDQIDKSWYIRLAKKYINDFLGIKGVKRNTRKVNKLKKECLAFLE